MSEYRAYLDDPDDLEHGWGVCDENSGVLYTAENLLSRSEAELLAEAHNAGCESYEQACAYIEGAYT